MEKFSESPNHHKETPDVNPSKDLGAFVRRLRVQALSELASKKDDEGMESA